MLNNNSISSADTFFYREMESIKSGRSSVTNNQYDKTIGHWRIMGDMTTSLGTGFPIKDVRFSKNIPNLFVMIRKVKLKKI